MCDATTPALPIGTRVTLTGGGTDDAYMRRWLGQQATIVGSGADDGFMQHRAYYRLDIEMSSAWPCHVTPATRTSHEAW